MVEASLIANAFILLSVSLAIWSLWWIVRGSLTNVDERNAEDEARRHVAETGRWADGPQPQPFTDEELRRLSDALAPQKPEDVGVDVRKAPPEPKRRLPWSSNRR